MDFCIALTMTEMYCKERSSLVTLTTLTALSTLSDWMDFKSTVFSSAK